VYKDHILFLVGGFISDTALCWTLRMLLLGFIRSILLLRDQILRRIILCCLLNRCDKTGETSGHLGQHIYNIPFLGGFLLNESNFCCSYFYIVTIKLQYLNTLCNNVNNPL
jgi:hypothetical protein